MAQSAEDGSRSLSPQCPQARLQHLHPSNTLLGRLQFSLYT